MASCKSRMISPLVLAKAGTQAGFPLEFTPD